MALESELSVKVICTNPLKWKLYLLHAVDAAYTPRQACKRLRVEARAESESKDFRFGHELNRIIFISYLSYEWHQFNFCTS